MKESQREKKNCEFIGIVDGCGAGGSDAGNGGRDYFSGWTSIYYGY